jgi:hypothetical protein
MRTFQDHFTEQLLDVKIGMLAYMFAYHKLSASNFVEWYMTEGRYLPEDELMMTLFENDPNQQTPQQQPQQQTQQPQQPNSFMGRLGNMAGRAGRWMYNNPVKTAGIIGTAINPAFAPMAMAGTWLGKKAYNWYQNRNQGQQGQGGQGAQQQGQGAQGQQQGQQGQQPDKVGQMAGQILPQLQQLKGAVQDPKGQQAIDGLLQYLGSAHQGAPGAATPAPQPTAGGGLQADKAVSGGNG